MKAINKICFTKKVIQNLPIPKNRQIYYDTYQSGLALLITYGGTKAFYFYKTVNHKTHILKIGDFPDMSIETARNKVYNLLKEIKSGGNIIELNKEKDITLSDFFYKEYIPRHLNEYASKGYKHSQELIFNNYFKDLHGIKISKITREDIELLHRRIGKNNGFYAANRMLALIRHMLNMAVDWGYINLNPTIRIRMYKEKSRDRFIQPSEMSDFMTILSKNHNNKMKDYIMLLLLTGQRGCNIRALKWSDIDFYNNILYLPSTKNGDSQRIPLTEQAIELLKQMYSTRSIDTEWIFPSKHSASGHLETPGPFWRKLLKESNIKNLRMHDLRRTMGSYQAITGSSLNIIGKSLGHRSIQATAIYAKLDLNPVRNSMQKATNEIFKLSAQ